MHRISLAAMLALSAAVPPAFAQVQFPSTVAAFAEPVLLGMKLSARRAERTGSATPARLQCLLSTQRSSFEPTVAEVLATLLTPDELHTTERFLATPVGQKYVKYGVLQVYQAVGEQLPEPLPDFSDAEYKKLEEFAATAAGKRLINDKVMQSSRARQAYDAQIRQVVSTCPN